MTNSAAKTGNLAVDEEVDLDGASTILGAVEGLKLSSAGRQRVSSSLPLDQRRAEVLRAYLDLKGRK